MDSHRVRRLRWQARASSPAQAFALRSLLREQGDSCQAALERAFDGADAPHEVWHLPRLALTIRAADLESLRSDGLADRVEVALRAALTAMGPATAQQATTTPRAGTPVRPAVAATPAAAEAASRRSAVAAGREALQHYLATGLLPWTLAGLPAEQAERALGEAAAQAALAVWSRAEPLDSLLPVNGTAARIGALQRWLPLLPAALRRRWLAAHSWRPALDAASVQAWRDWIDADDSDRIEWQALWLAGPLSVAELYERVAAQRQTGSGKPVFVDTLWAALATAAAAASPDATRHAVSDAPPAQPAAHLPAATGDAPALQATPSLLVPLAGLVLLHPWLPRLLAACGVLDDSGKEINPAQLPRGCALLHALASGNAPVAEHQLPFVKLLLGQAPDEPLAAALPALSPADHEEVTALLDAAREHWSALQGTGVDGLRLSFLQRRGLLSRSDRAWHLRMQGESFDLLLGLLPWSISLVRLPWMPQPLVVDWPLP